MDANSEAQIPDVDHLILRLQYTSSIERADAAAILGELRDIRAVDSLISALRSDADEAVRISAANALGTIGNAAAISPLIQSLHDWSAVASTASDVLGRFGDAALLPLLQALQDSDSHVRFWAAAALRYFRSPQIIQPLILALTDSDPRVRRSAVQTLGVLADRWARVPLIGMLRDADWEVRAAALDALRHFALMHALETEHIGEIIDIFTQQLDTPDEQFRVSAAKGFEQFPSEQAIPLLIRALHDPSPTIRAQAAHALGATKSVAAVEPLLDALTSPNLTHDMGQSVAMGLSRIGSISFAPLVRALDDGNANVRFWSATALGYLGMEQALSRLHVTAENDMGRTNTHALVSTAAKKAIKHIQRRQAEKKTNSEDAPMAD